MSPKAGTVFPKTGTNIPGSASVSDGLAYALMVAAALQKDFRGARGGTKAVMRWTGASERTVKHWFAGTRGPCGEHFLALIKHSDEVFEGFLRLTGRDRRMGAGNLAEVRAKLVALQRAIDLLWK